LLGNYLKNGVKMKKIIFLLIIAVFFAGCSQDKISGNEEIKDNAETISYEAQTVSAKVVELYENYEAVGTIRPKTEARIDSQIQAQVVKVKVGSGDRVKKGDVLALLDDRSLKAKLSQANSNLKSAYSSQSQAKQDVVSAEAVFENAKSDYERIKKYYDSKAATKRDFEQAKSSYLQAKAGLASAKEALDSSDSFINAAKEQVREAEVAFDYTKITAPETGEILKKMVDEGDLALPGKPLFILQTSGALTAEVYVREGLVSTLKKGQSVEIFVESAGKKTFGIIEEIVPYADPETRTFLIKASIDDLKDLYPGMYAKLLIPINKRRAVVIPKKAVIEVGQLKMVNVFENNRFIRIYVKTGADTEEGIEILGGLNENDRVVVN
jgi:RND family efflux transporter MFP subunit